MLPLCEMVGMRLRQAGFCARLVSVYLRRADLTGQSHQKKFDAATDHTMKIFQRACWLMEEIWPGVPLRGMGVRVSGLVPGSCLQLSLFEPYDEKKRRLDEALDILRMRFGPNCDMSAFFSQGLPL